MKRYSIGNFKVLPLSVPHGETPNFAFVIDHEDMGRLLFCTDAECFNYKIADVNHIFMEANYSEEIAIKKLMDNETLRSQSHTHMEINATIKAIQRLCNPLLQTVGLIHLSDGLSDERAFFERVYGEVGIKPIALNKGDVIELKLSDF